MDLPLIDVSPLVTGDGDRAAVAGAIDRACRDHGFFLVSGHGVPAELETRLDEAARAFFALPGEVKASVAMARSGRVWRGWFPVGGELTSGVPDRKEGYYFGQELSVDDPRVAAGTPLHGPNPFPEAVPELRSAVLEHLDAMTGLGHVLMSGIALGLGLERDHFRQTITTDPTILFRIFHYPAGEERASEGWGVAEHTDYGLLTMLRQDDTGGLEVHTPRGWVDATPVPDTFVCNLGDMLERITGGRYRSTPHRVRPPVGDGRGVGRLSFPFFFDPSWDAVVEELPLGGEPGPEARARWDGSDPLAFDGTYGEYLTAKVAKVFPDLFRSSVE